MGLLRIDPVEDAIQKGRGPCGVCNIYLLYFFDGQHRGMNSSSVTSEHAGAE